MRQIVNYPDPVLRVKTKRITAVNKTLLSEVEDLTKLLKSKENGAGLAAPQIGVEKRFFGLKNTDSNEVVVYVNPTINVVYGKKTYPLIVGENKDGFQEKEDFLEGCLSFPSYWGTVKRFLKIEASWQELEKGKLVDKKKAVQGFEAIVFQHELDHLDGILFIDHIKEDEGRLFKQVGKEMIRWSIDKV